MKKVDDNIFWQIVGMRESRNKSFLEEERSLSFKQEKSLAEERA